MPGNRSRQINLRFNYKPLVEAHDMSSDSTAPDPRLEVQAYLNTHPSAADTLDGIIQWWLPIQRYETSKDVIQKALDNLVQQGIVEYVETGDGRRIFRLAQFQDDESN